MQRMAEPYDMYCPPDEEDPFGERYILSYECGQCGKIWESLSGSTDKPGHCECEPGIAVEPHCYRDRKLEAEEDAAEQKYHDRMEVSGL